MVSQSPPAGTHEPTYDNYVTRSWISQIPELEEFVERWAARFEPHDDVPLTERGRANLEEEFLNELHQQPWWISHTGTYRANAQMRIEEPASWEEQQDIYRGDARRWASALGYTLTDEDADYFADYMAQTGATPAEVERAITDKFFYSAGEPTRVGAGAIRGYYDRIKEFARDNFVTIKDERLWEYAHDIKSEARTEESVLQIVTDFTKAQYGFLQPDFVDRLHGAGLSLADHLEPVRQAVAAKWEIDPSELQMSNQWFQDNLLVNDNGTERFINSREAGLLAHRDNRYKTTDAHKEQMSNFSNTVLQLFGAV